AFERARVIWPLFGFAVGDGELTQDLLYRPPIERKLSDEPSSNRLDTILVDLNSDGRQPHDFALPLPMPLVKPALGRQRKRFVNHRVEPMAFVGDDGEVGATDIIPSHANTARCQPCELRATLSFLGQYVPRSGSSEPGPT